MGIWIVCFQPFIFLDIFFCSLVLKKASFAHYLQILKAWVTTPGKCFHHQFSQKETTYLTSIIRLTTWTEEHKYKRNKTMNWWKLLHQCVTLSHVKWALMCNTRALLISFLFVMTKFRHWKNHPEFHSDIVSPNNLFLKFPVSGKTKFLHEAIILEIIEKKWYLFQVLP